LEHARIADQWQQKSVVRRQYVITRHDIIARLHNQGTPTAFVNNAG
jgi:hypothetical protein